MERTLQVLDYAVLVISGKDGVQGHTATLWRLLKKYGIPAFIFVNKMDLDGSDRESVAAELQKKLDAGAVDFTGAEKDGGRHEGRKLLQCAMRSAGGIPGSRRIIG